MTKRHGGARNVPNTLQTMAAPEGATAMTTNAQLNSSHPSKTGSSKPKRSSASARERKRKEIELRRAEEILRLEETEARRQLQRNEKLIEIWFQQQLVDLEEEDSHDEADSFEDDLSEDNDVRSQVSEQSAKSKVQSWISARDKQMERRGATDCGERIKSSPPLNPCSETARPDSKLDRYLARQTIGKDVPSFSGQVTEWPLFVSTFKNTTRDCGFTPSENATRLRNCLKGDALESVRSLLMNVEQTLIK